MHIVFYSTSDVFKAEELLINTEMNCRVVPTPVQDKAYCGVCIEIVNIDNLSALDGMEFEIIE